MPSQTQFEVVSLHFSWFALGFVVQTNREQLCLRPWETTHTLLVGPCGFGLVFTSESSALRTHAMKRRHPTKKQDDFSVCRLPYDSKEER